MRYFVYDLIDPRTGKTFYVGKGHGDRPNQHLREAGAGIESKKCTRIREIWTAGLQPRILTVKRFRHELDAYNFEKARIARIGLSDLTNVVPGGGGVRTPTEAWGKQDLERYATRLAFYMLAIANGCRIVAKIDSSADITDLWRAVCHRFIQRLGVSYVRKRLKAENIYFWGREPVHIPPSVMRKIMSHRGPIQLSLFRPSKIELLQKVSANG